LVVVFFVLSQIFLELGNSKYLLLIGKTYKILQKILKMTKKNNSDAYLDSLRKKALKQLEQQGVSDVYSLAEQTNKSLIHELSVHQIELEMQNESLLKTQESLELEQRRYFDLYDLAPFGYITINEAGFIIESNLMAATLLNTSRDSLINRPLSLFIQPEDYHIYYLNKDKLFKTGDPQIFELRTAKKTDQSHLIRMTAVLMREPGGVSVCRIAIFDITQIRKAEEDLKLSEEKHRMLFETMIQGVVYQDSAGRITSANPSAERILGQTLLQMQGATSQDPRWRAIKEDGSYFSGDEHPSLEALRTGKEVLGVVMGVFNAKNDAYTWISINAIPQFKSGNRTPYQVYTTFEDITERRKTETALRDSLEKFSKIFQNSPYAITITRAEDGMLVESNDAFKSITGFTSHEADSSSSINLKLWVNMDNRAWVISELKKGREVKDKEFEFSKKNGEILIGLFSAQNIHIDNEQFILSSIIDITSRKKNEEEILHMSYHDKLTGLYNRRFVEEEIKRLDTERQLPLSIIMGDLNGLKIINDTFGHNEGDRMLLEATGLLTKISRSEDILARWGGDEFVILLPKTSIAAAEDILLRIKNECEDLTVRNIPLGLAIGIATKTELKQNVEEIITEAEGNMYKNKLVEKQSHAGSIIFALEQTLFEKSNETMEHTFRLKNFALKLGKSIKLHASEMDELSLLASLHDIGKVAISEEILLKEGKLTEKEWEIIKRHPETGYNIAQASPQIIHIARFILACHENWDGSGYPRGLAREEIPLLSRIVAIADAYDVMTSERSYKTAMNKYDAIKELTRCSGSQFDPVLVEKFIEVLLG